MKKIAIMIVVALCLCLVPSCKQLSEPTVSEANVVSPVGVLDEEKVEEKIEEKIKIDPELVGCWECTQKGKVKAGTSAGIEISEEGTYVGYMNGGNIRDMFGDDATYVGFEDATVLPWTEQNKIKCAENGKLELDNGDTYNYVVDGNKLTVAEVLDENTIDYGTINAKDYEIVLTYKRVQEINIDGDKIIITR